MLCYLIVSHSRKRALGEKMWLHFGSVASLLFILSFALSIDLCRWRIDLFNRLSSLMAKKKHAGGGPSG